MGHSEQTDLFNSPNVPTYSACLSVFFLITCICNLIQRGAPGIVVKSANCLSLDPSPLCVNPIHLASHEKGLFLASGQVVYAWNSSLPIRNWNNNNNDNFKFKSTRDSNFQRTYFQAQTFLLLFSKKGREREREKHLCQSHKSFVNPCLCIMYVSAQKEFLILAYTTLHQCWCNITSISFTRNLGIIRTDGKFPGYLRLQTILSLIRIECL